MIISAFTCTEKLHAADYTVTSSSDLAIDFSSVEPGETIWLQGHTRQQLILMNVQGTAEDPIIITNTGGQFIIDNNVNDKGIQFWNSKHFVIYGTPDPPNYDYGIKVANLPDAGGQGIVFIKGTTDFELHSVEITGTGYSGITAKSDEYDNTEFLMENIKIHNCYIHNTGHEGMYIGSSFFTGGAHHIHNVEIYNNLLVDIGADGIQVGCATQGASIHDNVIIRYGVAEEDPNHKQGIRINPGTAGLIYNNWIEGDEDSYIGILANVYGDTAFYNNVIIRSSGEGIVIGDGGAPNGSTVLILNNTLVETGYHGIVFYATGTTEDNLIANNIIAEPNGSYYVGSGSPDLTQSGNLYVSTVAAAGFVDAGSNNFQLTSGSDAVDAGDNLSGYGVTFDFDNTERPQGADFDIGAFERIAESGGEPELLIITPAASGVASGSGWQYVEEAIDDQPTWDDVNEEPDGTHNDGYYKCMHQAGNTGYFDFGEDYAEIHITQTWTRYYAYADSSHVPPTYTMWWDDDTDTTNDGTTEAELLFGTQTFSSSIGNTWPWYQDTDLSSSPVTPAARYLLVKAPSPFSTTFMNEWAFVGYIGEGVINEAPTVDAGPDDNSVLESGATDYNLDGTVSDDGLPNPPGAVTVTWSQISGPGTATFGNANAVDTGVDFSATGVYVLRLTADDGDESAYDEVTITVTDDPELQIITPAASGVASGSGWQYVGEAIDDQPTWDDVNEEPDGAHNDGYYKCMYQAGNTGYFDFGANYADVRITQTWTRYYAYADSSHVPPSYTMWWDDDTDTTNDGTTETELLFGTQTFSSSIGNTWPWYQDTDLSGSPVTPAARYLLVKAPSPFSTTFMNEWAFVGYMVE